jgi:hypothetical protein
MSHQPLEQWVKGRRAPKVTVTREGAGANFIAVPAQLGDDPLAMNRFLARVKQNMHPPKAQ